MKKRVCKAVVVDTTMKEFKNKELKSTTNKVIQNPKQAIAIGLSISKNCPNIINFSKLSKDKMIQFLKKNEIIKILIKKKIIFDKKNTKLELGKLLKKDDIIEFIN